MKDNNYSKEEIKSFYRPRIYEYLVPGGFLMYDSRIDKMEVNKFGKNPYYEHCHEQREKNYKRWEENNKLGRVIFCNVAEILLLAAYVSYTAFS